MTHAGLFFVHTVCIPDTDPHASTCGHKRGQTGHVTASALTQWHVDEAQEQEKHQSCQEKGG